MAEAWSRPDDDGSKDGGTPPRPFDRQALQATLADAVRNVADADTMDTPPNKPLRGPGSTSPVVSEPVPEERQPVLAPRPQPARSVNPFSRGGSAPDAAAPAPAVAAPAPKRPASLLGGGTPSSVASNQGSGLGSSSGLGASGLSGGGLASPVPAGSGGLRSPGGLGPMNFSGDNRVTGDLGGGRSASALAPVEADQPTIPLRRRQPAQAPAPARPTVSIEGWTPTDDDILPRRVVKRSFRRR
jgi:hypothetical protein